MQRSLRSVRAELGDDDYVYISIANDSNIPAADLAQYANQQGFDWRFVTVTPEFIRELVGQYGPIVVFERSQPRAVEQRAVGQRD